MPRRSSALAQRWQDRLDQLVMATAITAIVGVALQTLAKTGPLHILGLLAALASWLIFAVDAAVMLSVSPAPRQWVRGHPVELALLVLTCPLWAILFYDLLLLELLPALTVLEATKLAKLVKVVSAVRRSAVGRGAGRVSVAVVLLAALAVAVEVLRH